MREANIIQNLFVKLYQTLLGVHRETSRKDALNELGVCEMNMCHLINILNNTRTMK